MEINPSITLKTSPSLRAKQEEQLFTVLRKHLYAFAWDYKEIKWVHALVCTHYIYIKEGHKPMCQPQTRMNPTLIGIVKEEFWKLLDARFIYPILDSERVSPLVIVPKNKG